MHDISRYSALLKSLLHFLLVLFARHWMTGLTNLGLTALFGLGLVWVAEHWRLLGLRQQTVLQLRRIILLVALIKGAFYLVMGETLHAQQGHRWIVGIQFPSPDETAWLLAQTHYSIWHPTEVSEWVSLALGGLATAYLFLRVFQLFLARRSLDLWVRLGGASSSARSSILLTQAAQRLRLPRGISLPKILEIDLPGQNGVLLTPLLLGLRRPLLLIPPRLLTILTDAELELVLRHELAHLARRDHWWRWLLLWITDVGGLTGLVFPLKATVIEIEERLCDRRAVQSPAEALLLANALQVVASSVLPTGTDVSPDLTGSLLMSALPMLLGGYVTSWQPPGVLRGRLEGLLAWSKELSANQKLSANQEHSAWKTKVQSSRTKTADKNLLDKNSLGKNSVSLGSAISLWTIRLIAIFFRCLLSLLLLLVLYAKFHLTLNVR